MRQSCLLRSIGSMLSFVNESRSKRLRAEGAPPGQPSDVNSVFARVLQGVAGVNMVDISGLCEALENGGFQHLSDLGGLEANELVDLVPAFSGQNVALVKAFLAQCQRQADRELAAAACQQATLTEAASSSSGAGAEAQTRVASQSDPREAANDEQGRAGLILLGESRRARVVPEPPVLAAALAAAARCNCYPGAEPIGRPREEVKRARRDVPGGDHLHLHTLWVEFAAWRKSAPQYASAVRLWGEAARAISAPSWPPPESVLNAFVGLFRNGNSLQKSVPHVRSVLYLLQAPLGVLDDAERLARGAEKITRDVFRRVKIRATAEETKLIRKWCAEAGYPLLAASWVIARQFCLRYSELLLLGSNVVTFRFSGDERKTCVIRFAHRKCYNEPCETTRRCICQLQGRSLCGVCELFSVGAAVSVPFASVQFADALAVLKLAAAALQLRSAAAWGTHAFRRGFADEALQQGGPAALFFSGGWKGVAAFGYVSAQSRGALSAAEWLVDHSDSSDGEQA